MPDLQQEQSYMGAYPHAQVVNYGDRPVMISEYRMPESITTSGDEFFQRNSTSFFDAYNSPQAYGSYDPSWDRDVQYNAATDPPRDAFNGTSTLSASNAYFLTERRQIVVTGFPHKARSDEVASWIRKRMGHHANLISRIDGPAEYSKTAYVTLASSATLRPGVEALDYQLFQGNKIKAKVAKEGMPSEDLEPKSARKTEKSSKSQRSKSKISSSTSTSTRASSSTKTKTTSSNKSEPDAKKGKVDRSRSVGGVLIVDGSGGSRSVTSKEASKSQR